MRDDASTTGQLPAARPLAAPPPAVPPPAVLPEVVLRPPLALRIGASVALAALIVVLVTVVVVPPLDGSADAPGALPWTVSVALSIVAVVLLVACWRVRLAAATDEVTRVRLFSDAHTITWEEARRIEVSTSLADPSSESRSMLPTIILTGVGDTTITSRENRREADVLLPYLLAWSRQRPELVKDPHTLRFFKAYHRATP
ncbi:hypothetical protein [Sanguibacter antarcticus]|uniref:Uncharacterized protein n=1 Tax=Sanguibacter antarcticus TaxID=372484 RepID=A0A2A9E639_9MICO|nr:hypothetical protein [Sanguibacter antarcticus]PFG34428.1 hypothetical protein ATL42_2338 [Sanguibacter antarcticus]